MADWIPGISQLKSAFQAVCGDEEGARRTQKNFLRQCPGVSQVTSFVQLVKGDEDGALETQKQCFGTMSNFVDGIPVIGHAKGLVHYIARDEAGGDRAMKSSTRTTAVIGAGAGAFLVSGPVGAAAAGIGAGVAVDAIYTEATGKDHGYIAAIENVANADKPAGAWFDLSLMPVGDAVTGIVGNSAVQNVQNGVQTTIQMAKHGKLSGDYGLAYAVNQGTSQAVQMTKYAAPAAAKQAQSSSSRSSSSGSQPPNEPQRNWGRSYETEVEKQLLARANREVIQQMLDYIAKTKPSIPKNAMDWIRKIVQDPYGTMSRFHLQNASPSSVVQVDYEFSGRNGNGQAWFIRFSINADYANENTGQGPHYGGEVEWRDVRGNKGRAVGDDGIHVWLKRVPAGRINDKAYKMEKYPSGEKEEYFDDGGSAQWESTSTKTGY